jgi:hypothetical protein
MFQLFLLIGFENRNLEEVNDQTHSHRGR